MTNLINIKVDHSNEHNMEFIQSLPDPVERKDIEGYGTMITSNMPAGVAIVLLALLMNTSPEELEQAITKSFALEHDYIVGQDKEELLSWIHPTVRYVIGLSNVVTHDNILGELGVLLEKALASVAPSAANDGAKVSEAN